MKLTRENLKDFGIVPEGDVVIPGGITEIGEGAFSHCSNLSSVAIPDTVTVIGKKAFSHCENLSSVVLPEGLTEICNCVFSHCYNLSSVEIPNTATVIGVDAFAFCNNLISIELPEGLTEIGEGAFYRCKNLKIVKIPNSVTKIGREAFLCCTNLTIEVPITVKDIGEDAFYAVAQVIYQGSDKCVDQIVLTRDDIAKYHISTIGEITIPKKLRDSDGNWHEVVGIGTGAFYNCIGLTSIILPENISIGTGAFMRCINAVIVVPASVRVEDHAFDDVKNITYDGNQPGAPWGANDLNFYHLR